MVLIQIDYEQHHHSVKHVEQVRRIWSHENITEVAKLEQRVNREDKASLEFLSSLGRCNRVEWETLPNYLAEDVRHGEERDCVAETVSFLEHIVEEDNHEGAAN